MSCQLTRPGHRREGARRLDRRRPGHLRRRGLRDQPALGEQQPDDQRRDALAAGRRRLRSSTAAPAWPSAASPAAGRRTSPTWSPRASSAARDAGPGRGRRAADQRRRRRAPATGTPTRPRRRIEVFRDVAPALGQAFGEARDRGQLLFGFAEHSMDDRLPRHLDRAAAAARPADRPGGAQRQERRLHDARSGPAPAPATSATCRSPTSPPRWTAGSAGRSARSSCPPGATRRCCRPRRSAT